MKLYPVHSKRFFKLLQNGILVVLLLLALVSCSSGQDGEQVSSALSELEQLKEENEKLRTELENAAATSEGEEAPKVLDNEDQEPELSHVNFLPPEQEPKDSLPGEWFLQKFHEEGIFSWTQSMVLYENGSGTMNRTYYVPKDNVESLPDFDSSINLTWRLNGDIVCFLLDNGESADFTFSFEEQTLSIMGNSTNPDIYARKRPARMEQYVERSLFAEDPEAKEALRRRRFLGSWYFDVLLWTFSEDGIGLLDIPKLGDQPAEKKNFSYTVHDDAGDPTFLNLIIDWGDGRTSYFYPTFNEDGSMILEGIGNVDPMKLTRTFDIDNCPVTESIISNQTGVFTGSIFSEILPEL